MVSDDHMWAGRMPFRIAVGTLLVFLAVGGGASAFSNGGGGRWKDSHEISSRSQDAVHEVDDGGVGGRRGGGWG